MNELIQDIFDTAYPSLAKKQCSPFGKESDIDFIDQDEKDYFAMADDIKEGEK